MVWVHNLNPILLDLPGPFQIGWYGLMYVFGILFTWWYVRRDIIRGSVHLTEDQLESVLLWAGVGMVIGARTAYVLLYNLFQYIATPWKVFAIWEGGLSYHGALVGITIAVWLWCRNNNQRFLALADILVVPIALANMFGRVGNFINGELWGRVTDVAWGVFFPRMPDAYRHPSALYEAAYNVVIFFMLQKLAQTKRAPGTILAAYLMLYAVFRSATEFFREPEILVGPLTMGQFLNVFMFLAGLGLLWWVRSINNKIVV